MGRSRLVRPDTKQIPISDGDWILIKRRLTASDARRRYQRSVSPTATDAAGEPVADKALAGQATVLAYLLDWSLSETEPTLKITHASEAEIAAATDLIDTDTYIEILRAIEAHEAALLAERTAEKNAAGATKSDPTSPLPCVPDSVSLTSVS